VKLFVEAGRCEGHGSCYFVDSDLFPLDDNGFTAVVDGSEVAPDQEQNARDGAQACPVLALRVEE
jgi:ferredoxin